MILVGDCLKHLAMMPDNSVDSIVTDPPYGLSFMGKKWDYDVPSVDVWRECLRVLKPGGHLLAFGGTRTYHRLVVNIEDAGFEVRDTVMWVYGSGFPKSLNISKAIDEAAGAEREVVGVDEVRRAKANKATTSDKMPSYDKARIAQADALITAPATPEAQQWSGWGTALKPANEPICVARKPLEKGLTVAQNVLKWGCGGLNIDRTRIGYADEKDKKLGQSARPSNSKGMQYYAEGEHDQFDRSDRSALQGRWPANVIFDEAAAAMLDEQSGDLSRNPNSKGKVYRTKPNNSTAVQNSKSINITEYGDSGGASRFFYVAKASKRERNAGLEGMPEKECQSTGWSGDSMPLRQDGTKRKMPKNQNHHPTVKPIKLMEYLIKLVTPPNGIVLDPFMGSGSTGVAAKRLGYDFIGIELNEEYAAIAEKRLLDGK